jgi:hypothetical protein
VQGEKRHFQPIARLFVIKKKICGLFQPRSGYFQQPVSGGAVVCWACSTAREVKVLYQPDGGEGK